MYAAAFETDAGTSLNNTEAVIGSRLKTYVNGMTSHFSCGGTLSLSKSPSVTLVNENGKLGDNSISIQVPEEIRPGSTLRSDEYTISRWSDPNSEHNKKKVAKRNELFEKQAADLKDLISVIPPATFGKGGETVLDVAVRDALQLKAEKFELNIPQDALDTILFDIKASLDLQTDIVAEPYSLNVYQKGGKFLKHKDTPRGDDMFGTLVICLPTWFTGGKMSTSMGREVKSFFEGEAPPNPNVIQWCAFFADVDHEIDTVKEGIRITAAYLLRRKDKAHASSMMPRTLQGQEQADRIKDCFVEGLRDDDFFAGGGSIGFPCLHLYTNTEVFPGKKDSSEDLAPKQIAKLKGRDQLIANAAASLGLVVRLVPYLSHNYSNEDGYGDYALAKFPGKKRCPARMSDDKIETHFKTKGREDPISTADLWVLDFESAASTKVGDTEWNADGYFGNEASDIAFYVQACLIIGVPEYSASRGVPVVAPKKKRAPKAKKVTSAPVAGQDDSKPQAKKLKTDDN